MHHSADVRFGIMDLYAACPAALGEGRYKDWADCFTASWWMATGSSSQAAFA